MSKRSQRTIRREVETSGVSFFTGADVKIRFLPAPPNYGIAFQRIDCDGSVPIPARLEYTLPRHRRTGIEHQGVSVEMIEHVMAALAGLQVDNCLVQLDAPEPPGFDGSSRPIVDCLCEADFDEQNEPAKVLTVRQNLVIRSQEHNSQISVKPFSASTLVIEYQLDYGPRSPIAPQNLTIEITPQTFCADLAFARKFILDSEIEYLRAQGYGQRVTAKDLLVFSQDGVVDNQLRSPDECVRHKILDCLGDLALLGCDLHGHVIAYRSGHGLNREAAHRLKMTHLDSFETAGRKAG